MAAADTVQGIIDYYVNLLIIQYNNKPKARATIAMLVRELLADGIIFDVRDGYAIDTAVGVQLDVIGLYVGVDRFYNVVDLVDFFALTDYSEIDPELDDKYGFTDYTDFDGDNHNGTLTYQSFLSETNTLSDDDYRVIIKLKILQNNINHSHKSIDDGIFELFGNTVRPSSEGDMQMFYFIDEDQTAVIKAALYKKLLPRPMAVGMTLIENVTAPFFGYATYQTYEEAHPNVLGFADYSNYDTLEGKFLGYNNLTQV